MTPPLRSTDPSSVRPSTSRSSPAKAVDLLAGVPQTRDADTRLIAEVQQGTRGQAEQVDAARRDVLAELPRLDE